MKTKTATHTPGRITAPWLMTPSEIESVIAEAIEDSIAADRMRIRSRTNKNREWAIRWEDRASDTLAYFRTLRGPLPISKEERLANAAPELLAAAIAMMAEIDAEAEFPSAGAIISLRDAIAKAEGR